MAAYLTVARFKLLSTIPGAFVDVLEANDPGYVDAQLAYWSDWMDSQLRKRYAAPFELPIPGAIEGWLARIVTPRVWSKRGIDPEDKQWQETKQDDTDARAEIALAANSETGLFDLPLRANTLDSGIARAFPRAYSEQSPYVWSTQQAQRGFQEDDSGTGELIVSVQTDISRMIKSLSKMEGMIDKCGPDMALAIKADLTRTIAKGTDPYGVKWALTKPDPERGRAGGEVPLTGAAKAVTVTAMGPRIYIVVDGPEAKHHLGAVKGKVKRRVIPSKKKIPDAMILAIRAVLNRYFESEVKSGA